MTSRKEHNVIIAGASSDIGLALAKSWGNKSNIIGTYRTLSKEIESEKDNFSALFPCDFSNNSSIDTCAYAISKNLEFWDVLVMCSATMEPIGAFNDCDIDDWELNIQINLIGQLRFVHRLLGSRRASDQSPIVLFFAGGGTNGVPLNFSGYTLSKVALIKSVELLDAEMPDIRFSILGPGWVKTKIHEQTLRAGDIASSGAASKTVEKMHNGDFVAMEKVIACCDWLVAAPKSLIGGRNFSAAHDFNDTDLLTRKLSADKDMFKLRRYGNDFLERM